MSSSIHSFFNSIHSIAYYAQGPSGKGVPLNKLVESLTSLGKQIDLVQMR